MSLEQKVVLQPVLLEKTCLNPYGAKSASTLMRSILSLFKGTHKKLTLSRLLKMQKVESGYKVGIIHQEEER